MDKKENGDFIYQGFYFKNEIKREYHGLKKRNKCRS